jgi:hypothetical protein
MKDNSYVVERSGGRWRVRNARTDRVVVDGVRREVADRACRVLDVFASDRTWPVELPEKKERVRL